MALLKDFSASAVIAGFVTVLVGFTSSFVIVFQAALVLGASPTKIGSWMFALGLGMGLTCIVLSLRYRVPVVTAWSTPSAAMLITTAAGVPMGEAVGARLTFLSGFRCYSPFEVGEKLVFFPIFIPKVHKLILLTLIKNTEGNLTSLTS